MNKKPTFSSMKKLLPALPLVAAAVASLVPLKHVGHQFLILIILVWFQVFWFTGCLVTIHGKSST